jgi:peptidoglycan-associated lipoprotein
MLNKFSKLAAIAVIASVLAACGDKEEPSLTTNNGGNSSTNGSNLNNGQTSSITPGSLEDFRQNVGDRVLFGTDEYTLSSEAQNTLSSQATWLKKYAAGRTITIEGHADERGTREYNIALGARRANSVRSFLASQGIPTSSFNAVSYGKERPEVEGSNPESWAANRRSVVVPQ